MISLRLLKQLNKMSKEINNTRFIDPLYKEEFSGFIKSTFLLQKFDKFVTKNLIKNMNQSTHNKILNKVKKNRRGIVFFPSDFSELGSVDAIKICLSRLKKEKILERLAQGIYLYPKKHPVYGNLYPSTEEIAEQIARRDHAHIIPTGSAALHKLRLTTQIPMNIVYLTDGAPRKIKIGKQKITFKATTAKKLATKGKISTLVIQALQELGQKKIDESILAQLKLILASEDIKHIKHDSKLAPAWIAKILNELTEVKNDKLA